MRDNLLILITDDNARNLQVLGKMLKNEGYNVAAVTSGEEALDFVDKRLPDLILLDIMMPGIDGYEVCERLKEDQTTKEIPVIFISALDQKENKLKGFEIGGIDFVTKPFQEQEVLARIKTHLELKTTKERLERENKWFQTLVKNYTDPIVIIDEDYLIKDVNAEFIKDFKYELEEIKGDCIAEFMEHKLQSDFDIIEFFSSHKQNSIEKVLYNKEDEAQYFLIKATPVSIDGKLMGGFIMYININEIKKREARIRYLSFHDELTGLYNRRYFENELERLDDSRRVPISIIVGDLDQLKYINDNYGHKVGDEFLVACAEAFNEVTRSEDIVARIGGDEFSVILPDTSADLAGKVCNRIKTECEEVNKSDELQEDLKISLGYSTKLKEEDSLEEVFNQADHRMYDDKKEHRK
ncbi:MAG: diguanylate cyclase [Halanaerobacter sp.]